MRLYVLNEQRQPVTVDSFEEWGEWLYKNKEKRIIASSHFEDGTIIITAFMAHSTPFSDENDPQTFQTQVYGGDHNGKTRYYASWEQAEEGHRQMVLEVRKAIEIEWPEEIG